MTVAVVVANLKGQCTSDRPAKTAPVVSAVADAERSVERVRLALESDGADMRAVRAAADGTARLIRLLATITDRLAERAATTVDDSRVADDLIADLKALRNCLATGAALVEPTLDDLRDWTDSFDVDKEFAACWQEWAAVSGATSER